MGFRTFKSPLVDLFCTSCTCGEFTLCWHHKDDKMVACDIEARITGKARMGRKVRVASSPRRVRIIRRTRINSTIC